MIKKENRELSRCKITFPKSMDNEFMGCFEIHDNVLEFWIEFDKNDSIHSVLLQLFKDGENHTALITDGNGLGYSCFGCFPIDDFIGFHLDFGLIKFFCSRWVESLHIDSEQIPFVEKVYYEFPFIEYWFSGVNEASFSVSDEYVIKCYNKTQHFIDSYKCVKQEKRHCYFEVQFHQEKTLEDIVRVEEMIWLFLRFATDIPIPRAIICIPYCDIPEKYYTYHFQFGHHPIIKDYASVSSYINMPLKLIDIINKRNVFSKWNSFLHKHYHAIKMWSKEMSSTSLLDERIGHYVQIIDSLTRNISKDSLKERIQQCLKKYASILPFEINEKTSENLKRIRVSFSHLNDKDFIPNDEISGKMYLRYERIVKELIRIIITDRIGLER